MVSLLFPHGRTMVVQGSALSLALPAALLNTSLDTLVRNLRLSALTSSLLIREHLLIASAAVGACFFSVSSPSETKGLRLPSLTVGILTPSLF